MKRNWWCKRCNTLRKFRPMKQTMYLYECTTCLWNPDMDTRKVVYKLAKRPRPIAEVP